jgi:hypothetical protein
VQGEQRYAVAGCFARHDVGFRQKTL